MTALLATNSLAQQKRQKPVPPPSESAPAVRSEASESRANLIDKTKAYRQSLEQVQALQKREEERLGQLVAKRRELFDAGIIARRELEQSQVELAAATQELSETSRQIAEADDLVTEVLAAEQLASAKPEPGGFLRTGVTLIRYLGTSSWSLDSYSTIDTFFREKFGRSLPVSAFGQSGTHDRLGFDHRGALDVALHPDTAEGQALMAYLRTQGISFIAFRAAVAGSATGAHIHIGPPSHRTSL
jgi:hypothetical protein